MATEWLPDVKPWTRGDLARRCIGTVKNGDDKGRRCRSFAIEGGTVCAGPSGHGGGAPQVRRKAAERVAAAKVEAELARFVGEVGADVKTPTEALEILVARLEREARMAGVADMLVDRLATGPGTVDSAGKPVEALYGPDHLGDLRPHPLVAINDRWSDAAARHAKLALDANIADRQVSVVEEQVALVTRAFDAALAAEPSVDAPTRARVLLGFAAQLRAIDATAIDNGLAPPPTDDPESET